MYYREDSTRDLAGPEFNLMYVTSLLFLWSAQHDPLVAI
jgi:hypothetical protein